MKGDFVAIKPILQALVLADQVYVDARSGKKIVAGTFNRLWGRSFPTSFGRPTHAFICLTDVRGTLNLTLRYKGLANNNTLLELQGLKVESSDPLSSVEMIVEVPPLPMPAEGIYAFELYSGESLLGSLRVLASLIPSGANPQPSAE